MADLFLFKRLAKRCEGFIRIRQLRDQWVHFGHGLNAVFRQAAKVFQALVQWSSVWLENAPYAVVYCGQSDFNADQARVPRKELDEFGRNARLCRNQEGYRILQQQFHHAIQSC